MKIKTISTVTGVNVVRFVGYTKHYYWIKNLSDSTLYVSTKPNPVADADDVSELTAKASTAIETDEGIIYILGAGKVEIHNTDSKLCPFETPGTGGGGGTVTVDSTLSHMSENPVQNRIITTALKGKANIADVYAPISGTNIIVEYDNYNHKAIISSNAVNDNLLINPDFKINQRNASGIVSGYGIDRWCGAYVIENDSNHIALTERGKYIEQPFEHPEILYDKSLTCSVFYDDKTIENGTAPIQNVDTQQYILSSDRVNAIIYKGNGSMRFMLWCVNPCKISAVKLEYGESPTPFISPEPATELRKCQRYYQKWSNYVALPFYKNSVTPPPFTVEMRNTPSYSMEIRKVGGDLVTITNVLIDRTHIVGIDIPLSVISDDPMIGYYINGTFDAEIY